MEIVDAHRAFRCGTPCQSLFQKACGHFLRRHSSRACLGEEPGLRLWVEVNADEP